MMRSPDLDYCLDSPYLWFDTSAGTLVTKDLESADKLLASVKSKKDVEQTVTAYQAMYAATLALVHSINYKVSGFRCIVTVLEEYFIKKGTFDKAHLDHLLKAQKLEGTPDENFQAAEEFIAAVRKILNLEK